MAAVVCSGQLELEEAAYGAHQKEALITSRLGLDVLPELILMLTLIIGRYQRNLSDVAEVCLTFPHVEKFLSTNKIVGSTIGKL